MKEFTFEEAVDEVKNYSFSDARLQTGVAWAVVAVGIALNNIAKAITEK